MKKIALLFISFLILFCDKTIIPDIDDSTFAPLNVGDVRQLIDPADSSTNLLSVIGKTERTDGQEVFIQTWKYGTHDPDTSYYFIFNGYYMSTQLDTVKDSLGNYNKQNPFQEQRLAVEHPNEGEKYIQIVGDSLSMIRMTKYFGTFNSFAGSIDSTFAFIMFENFDTVYIDTFLILCFAKDIGWVGTYYGSFNNLIVSLSYVKIGNEAIGELFPEKDPMEYSNRLKKLKVLLSYYSLIGKKKCGEYCR